MASNAFQAVGAQLMRSTDGGTTYTAIAELTKIQRSGAKANAVDVTNMDSTGNYVETLPTTLVPGDISFEGNYIPADATQALLQTDFDSRARNTWKVQLPGARGRWVFLAFVAELDFDLENDKAATISGKLTITGQPTFTPSV